MEEKKYTLKELKEKLTEKERKFCHNYIIKWNGAESARKAGYSEDCARQTAHENLTKSYIQQYIDFIKDDIEKEAGISKLSQVKGLLDIIGGADTSERDKISATTELNKMLGYNAPEKHDHTTKGESLNDPKTMTTDELVKRANALKSLKDDTRSGDTD